MSCGNPHDEDCSEMLALVYEYLDEEIDDDSRARILHHLNECGPCLQQFGLEQTVKQLVHRSCACSAPESLRVQIVTSIRQVTVTYRTFDA